MGEQTDYRLFTLDQAAKELRVRWEHVRELVETGQLRAVKIGSRYRVPASALAELGQVCQFGVSIPTGTEGPSGRPGGSKRPLREIRWRERDGGG